ncbi:hypothetical protein DYB32_008259 [Aphanomyces invadans]|uniref:EF-hand domain-containing protein n=1 Tax=Aphanomyces invadans TaxID=157072 RepID=A0A3R6VSB8_9STRA|nr:hypothetical protein DYB32_008259 [Aphanomyces invadans]
MPTPPPYPSTAPPSPFGPDVLPPDTFAPDTFPPDESPSPTLALNFPTFAPSSDDAPATQPTADDPADTMSSTMSPATSIPSNSNSLVSSGNASSRRRLSDVVGIHAGATDGTHDPSLVETPESTPDDPNALPLPVVFPTDEPGLPDTPTFPESPAEPTGVPDVATLSPDTDTAPSYLTTDFTAPAMAKNLASLFRLLRVFKVLRGIRLSKHAQALVLSLFESMRLLVNVIELLLVIFVLFAIAGVSLFQGALHQQCDNEYMSDGYLNVDSNGYLISGNGFRCSMAPNVGRSCMADGVCVRNLTDDRLNKNPNYGFTSFDNVAVGLLSVIEIASLSDWGSTMWNLAEARGLVVGLYFLVVIPVGGYFVVNLVIAVVHNAYTQKWKDIRDEFVSAKHLEAQKRTRRPSIIDMVVVKPLPATKLSHLELKTLATRFSSIDGRVKYKNFVEFFSPSSGVSNTVQNLREFLQSAKAAGLHSRSIFRFIDKDNSGDLSRDELVFGFQEIEERVGIKLDRAIVEALHDYLDVNNDGKPFIMSEQVTLTEFIEFADPPSKASTLLEQKVLIELSGYEHAEGRVAAIFREFDPHDTGMLVREWMAPNGPCGNSRQLVVGTISMSQFRSALARIGFSGSGIKYLSRDDTLRLSMRSLDSFQSTSPWAVTWITWRRRIARCIRHAAFTGIVNAALVVQLVCFNLKSFDPVDIAAHAGREAHIAVAQDIVAYVFGLEMVLKVTALGGRGYVVDKYNRFDGVLTIVGLVEVIGRDGAVVLPEGVVHAMFVCRVLRLLQLFRQWTNFRVLMETMVTSFRGLLHFVFLLFVVMYIFALIGKHLFGNEMTEDRGFPTPFYATFDNVWSALLTVFQVFSGDQWTDVLYACMRVHAVGGAIFVVVMFFTGNYLVVNIFLSILLQDFESDENEYHRSYFSTIADADVAHYYDVVVHWLSSWIDRFTPSRHAAASPRCERHHDPLLQQAKRRLRLKVEPMFSKLSPSFEPSSTDMHDKDDDVLRLHEIADIVLFKMDTHTIEIGPRQYFECFHGFEAIQFLIASGFCATVAEAEALGNRLIELERFKCEATSIGRQADCNLQAVIQATNPRRRPPRNHLMAGDAAEDAVLGLLDELIAAATQRVRYGPAGPFGNHTGVFSVHSSPWRNNIHAALEDAKDAHRRRDEAAASAREAKSLKFMVGHSFCLFGPGRGFLVFAAQRSQQTAILSTRMCPIDHCAR